MLWTKPVDLIGKYPNILSFTRFCTSENLHDWLEKQSWMKMYLLLKMLIFQPAMLVFRVLCISNQKNVDERCEEWTPKQDMLSGNNPSVGFHRPGIHFLVTDVLGSLRDSLVKVLYAFSNFQTSGSSFPTNGSGFFRKKGVLFPSGHCVGSSRLIF